VSFCRNLASTISFVMHWLRLSNTNGNLARNIVKFLVTVMSNEYREDSSKKWRDFENQTFCCTRAFLPRRLKRAASASWKQFRRWKSIITGWINRCQRPDRQVNIVRWAKFVREQRSRILLKLIKQRRAN